MNTVAKIARVLLADDHAEILAQTANVLAGEFEIVGSVANGLDLIKLRCARPRCGRARHHHAGLGWHRSSPAAQAHLGCRAKLVILTVHEDPDYVRAALQCGRRAYVVKARMASDLITAIHEALEGHRFVSPTLVSNPTE